MKILPLSGAALLLFATTVFADEATHRAAAEELLVVSRVETTLEENQTQQKEAVANIMSSLLAGGSSVEAVTGIEKFQARVFELLNRRMDWKEIKGDYVTIYMEVFSEQEIRDLTAFYKSPIGQKFLEKMPEVSAKTTEVVQERVTSLVPEIQKMALEYMGAAGGQGSAPPKVPASKGP